MKKLFITLGLSSIVLLGASEAKAAVAFSYEGWGVTGLPSTGATNLTKRQQITVKHTQKKDYSRNGIGLKVTVQKKGVLGYGNTSSSKTWYENQTNASYSPTLDSGTYRLYFATTGSGQSYYIKGTFNK